MQIGFGFGRAAALAALLVSRLFTRHGSNLVPFDAPFWSLGWSPALGHGRGAMAASQMFFCVVTVWGERKKASSRPLVRWP